MNATIIDGKKISAELLATITKEVQHFAKRSVRKPGGVGPMTTAYLLQNTLLSANRRGHYES